MSQHTPGPWTVFPGEHPGIDSKAHSIIVWGEQGDSCGILGNSDTEIQANARLIAAAPDLLAELQRMVDHFDIWAAERSMEASTETWAALHCAKAAITKATSNI